MSRRWKIIRKTSRKLGPVWIVKRIKHGKKQKGYFKFSTRRSKKYMGPLLANEWIAYRLAKMLHLNVAKIKRVKIHGKRGVVSIVQPAKYHYTWYQLYQRIHGRIMKHLVNPEQLLKTFVFDIWICNLDRHEGNLITFPVGSKYSFYLIDHGLALLGAMKWRGVPWDSSYWNHVVKYNQKYVRGLRSYIYSYQQLSPFVNQIQRIPPYEIKKIVESVPTSILSHQKKKIVKNLLLYRQHHLHSIVRLWIEER